MSQKILVVEIDSRNHGDDRRENIRGVQSPSQSHFHNRKLHPFPREGLKRQRRHAFEIRWVRPQLTFRQQFLNHRMNPREKLGEQLIADLLAGNADALVDSFQVRRRIQPGAESRIAQDRFQKRRGRALAICPGDVHRWVRAVRTPQPFHQHRYVFQIEFCRRRLRWSGQFASKCQEIADRALVIHFSSSAGRARWR